MPDSRIALSASHMVSFVEEVMDRKSWGGIPSSLREMGKSRKAPTVQ